MGTRRITPARSHALPVAVVNSHSPLDNPYAQSRATRMVEFLDYPTVRCGVVQEVVLVGRLTRERPGFSFQASSLPGHLIQCVVRGRTRHEVSGCRYDLSPGSVIWFHNDELQSGRV